MPDAVHGMSLAYTPVPVLVTATLLWIAFVVVAVVIGRAAGTVKLIRVPDDSGDQERFEVDWYVDSAPQTQIRLGGEEGA